MKLMKPNIFMACVQSGGPSVQNHGLAFFAL